jgi:hypothetical protein
MRCAGAAIAESSGWSLAIIGGQSGGVVVVVEKQPRYGVDL